MRAQYFPTSNRRKQHAKDVRLHGHERHLGWDIEGKRDPYSCLDLDPDRLYEEAVEVRDPLSRSA